MATWQRRARLFIGVFALIFAGVVALHFRRRAPGPDPSTISRMDPRAVVQSTGGHLVSVKGTREDVAIDYEKELTYSDGSSRLINVRITTTNRGDGRVFTVTGREGQAFDNPRRYTIDGNVVLEASDGLTARTEHVTYSDADATVRAPGPVEFARKRMTGRGIGFTYDNARDIATILDQAVVHIAPDDKGADAADVAAAVATIGRRDKYMRFERSVRLMRGNQVIESDLALAHLSDDDKRLEALDLNGNSRITVSSPHPGELQTMAGRDMNLKYGPDGQTLEHAVILGDAALQLAGDPGQPGRQISGNTIDASLAPDGSTPTALTARDAVQLAFPPENGGPSRTVRAAMLEAKGEPGHGLTTARFTGNVEYREKGGAGTPVDRIARSTALDARLKPAMSAIDDATFTGTVRFEEQKIAAQAAVARYLPDKGVLELSGHEPLPGIVVPHVVNERITVDATAIDVTLEGPKMKARGAVKSVLQPADPSQEGATRTPSLLKQDQPTNVIADVLDYDGSISKAVYVGNANLFQADTTIHSDDTLIIDDKTGDLVGKGGVTTSSMVEQVNAQTKVTERVRSVGTAKDFAYEDAARRAIYTGDAHLSGPQGDVTAPKIELYFKRSENELDRAEAYEAVTLRETGRTTTGSHMTYIADEQRYVVTGTPVTVLDECDRRTVGKTLTFEKTTDTIVVDGNKQFRTESKSGSKCPGG
jgi:lipopolysaccharide export system protein LptA